MVHSYVSASLPMHRKKPLRGSTRSGYQRRSPSAFSCPVATCQGRQRYRSSARKASSMDSSKNRHVGVAAPTSQAIPSAQRARDCPIFADPENRTGGDQLVAEKRMANGVADQHGKLAVDRQHPVLQPDSIREIGLEGRQSSERRRRSAAADATRSAKLGIAHLLAKEGSAPKALDRGSTPPPIPSGATATVAAGLGPFGTAVDTTNPSQSVSRGRSRSRPSGVRTRLVFE